MWLNSLKASHNWLSSRVLAGDTLRYGVLYALAILIFWLILSNGVTATVSLTVDSGISCSVLRYCRVADSGASHESSRKLWVDIKEFKCLAENDWPYLVCCLFTVGGFRTFVLVLLNEWLGLLADQILSRLIGVACWESNSWPSNLFWRIMRSCVLKTFTCLASFCGRTGLPKMFVT